MAVLELLVEEGHGNPGGHQKLFHKALKVKLVFEYSPMTLDILDQ